MVGESGCDLDSDTYFMRGRSRMAALMREGAEMEPVTATHNPTSRDQPKTSI